MGAAAGLLDVAALEATLAERGADAAARAARIGRPVLASATVPVDAGLDVAACVFAARGADERYFAWEQRERGFALAGLGSAWTVEGVPEAERFTAAATRCSEAIRNGLSEPGLQRPGFGPTWVGGFAFDADGGRELHWASLPPTLLVLPTVSITRDGDAAALTVNVIVRAGEDAGSLVGSAVARAAALVPAPIPLADPDPVGGQEITSATAPESYVDAVAQARSRIRSGEIEKVVLAREVLVEGSIPFRPATVFDGLRAAYPSCFCFCVGSPDVAFVGASPELLVRREGAGAATVAMAGSTRRSADPVVDDHLAQRLLHSSKDREEHAIVARGIEGTLAPLSIWVAAESEPSIVQIANIQHLATPVRAQLAEPLSVVALVGALHPTPAVGGEPWERARHVIALERMDRGWYAGPVGWMDASEDGEFCVALRCALLEGRQARCYAGVGVVADSDPEAELAETELKLEAVMTVLTGG